MDDAALGVDRRDYKNRELLKEKVQQHKQALHASGGKLALDKCTYILLQWAWQEGLGRLKSVEEATAQLGITESETGRQINIKQIEPTQGYRTLGIWIAADGNEETQKGILQAKIKEWKDIVPNSCLTTYKKQIAYKMFLWPQITYPMPCLRIPESQMKKLFRPVLDEILHTLNLNKNFPLNAVHRGCKLFGLEIDDAYHMQSIAQMKYFLGHTNMGDRTGDLIQIAVNYLELVSGIGGSPLLYPHNLQHPHVPQTWVKGLVVYLHKIRGKIELRREAVLHRQQINNQYLMQIEIDSRFNLELIQQCCLYLQVNTVADISTVQGNQIETWCRYMKGQQSILRWPEQGQSSKLAWRWWNEFINLLLTLGGTLGGQTLKLTYILGAWRQTQQVWPWIGNSEYAYNAAGEAFCIDGNNLQLQEETPQMPRSSLLPIQVTRLGNRYQKVRIPPHAPDATHTSEETQQIPAAYHRLIGQTRPTAKIPQLQNLKEDFTAASDGTVRQGRGGAAVSIHSNHTKGTLQSVIPVDGTPASTTSYRAELAEILAVLLITHFTLKGGSLTELSGNIYCDNEAAVKIYNSLEGTTPASIGQATTTDADMIQELWHWKGRLPAGIRATWVKSHQKECKDRPARLNRVVDLLESTQHHAAPPWETKTTHHMLPHTQSQLMLKGSCYTGKIDSRIQHICYNDDLKAYTLGRLKLETCENLVDWEPIGQYNCTLSWGRRATCTKFVFRWAPTNKRQHKLGKIPTPLCPLCNTAIETTQHVTVCKHAKAKAYRHTALNLLETKLINLGTHPDAITLLLKSIELEESETMPLIDSQDPLFAR